MEKSSPWQGLGDEAIEEWFLNHLTDSVADFGQLLAAIVHFQTVQQLDKAEACAGLLQDILLKHSADEQLLLLLEKRAAWQPQPEDYAASCFNTLAAYFKGRSLMQLYLAACGLKNGVQPQEALRRLQVLYNLRPGRYCYEKTWGVGKVTDLDEFDKQIIIDFEKKKTHRLAFAYAGETIQPLADDHFLAVKLRDPAKFQQWTKDNPAEAVKALLHQFGEMNLTRLRTLAVGLLIPEKDWSSFWPAAREQLASDALVSMPAGRNDSIRLLSEKKEFDERWRNDFMNERDMERILSETESLCASGSPQNITPELKDAVQDRLAFVARGVGERRPETTVRVLLLADGAGVGPEKLFDISRYRRPDLSRPERDLFSKTLNAVPVRMIRPFLKYLGRQNSLPGDDVFPDIVPRLSNQALHELAAYFCENGREEPIFNAMRGLFQAGRANIEMVSWLSRNLRLIGDGKICRWDIFAQTALALLQSAAVAGRKKDISRLLAIFTDEELLKEMLQAMSREQRLDFCRRLNTLAGLTAAARDKIATKIILLFPDLAHGFGGAEDRVLQPKWTSLRSYREKQAQLEKIIKEEIPRNSKEIGVARSYGDLRENFEYKAAREMQGILMRRKADLEKMLGEVKSTDFAGFQHEVAGQGNSVELKMPDGARAVYHILGELDSDEKLGIISCRSKLAEVLSGHRAGDQVEIPGENSPITCAIEAVRELPPEIKAWISGE